MAYTRMPVAREKIAEAKHLYERTLVPTSHIAALLGFSRNTLYRRAAEWGWKRRKTGALDLTRLGRSKGMRTRAVLVARPRKGGGVVPQAPQERVALAERIQALGERELDAVEQVLAVLGPSDPAEAERAARTLASVARMLRELLQLDLPTTSSDRDHDEPPARDLAELRRSLARKLAALTGGDAGALPGEP